MRIIKKGKKTEYRAECPRCRSIIGYVFDDMKETQGSEYLGDWEYTLMCPQCGKEMPISILDNMIYPHA